MGEEGWWQPTDKQQLCDQLQMVVAFLLVAKKQEPGELQVKMWCEELFQADFQDLLPVEKLSWNQLNLCLFLKQAHQ